MSVSLEHVQGRVCGQKEDQAEGRRAPRPHLRKTLRKQFLKNRLGIWV